MTHRALFLIGAVLLGGCATEAAVGASHRTPESPSLTPAEARSIVAAPSDEHGACPLQSQRTRVGVQDVLRGAALVFTTSDDTAALRGRAVGFPVPASLRAAGTRTDNVHGGVRIIFEAASQDGADALRREVHMHARRLADSCNLSLAKLDDPKAGKHDDKASKDTAEDAKKGDAKKDEKPDEKKDAQSAPKSDTGATPDSPAANGKDKKKTDKPKDGDKPKEDAKTKAPEKPKTPEKSPLLP